MRGAMDAMGRGLGKRRRDRRERQLARLAALLDARGYQANIHDASFHGFDLLALSGARTLAIVLRDAPDARHDHLLSRLAEALLTASAACILRDDGWLPVGVVDAPHLTDAMSLAIGERVPGLRAGLRNAEAGWGLMDDDGLVRLVAPDIDVVRETGREPRSEPAAVFDPFTDRGQWLLKVLLAAQLPDSLIHGVDREQQPRAKLTQRDIPRTAYQLGPKAGVSTPTADRVVRWLRAEGYIDDPSADLRLHRVAELLARWRGRYPGPSSRIPAAWHLRTRDSLDTLRSALVQFAGDRTSAGLATGPLPASGGMGILRPRACLASFTACEALGVSVVRGMTPRIYLERPEETLRELGLRHVSAGQSPDVLVFKPSHAESIFRASVERDGVAACDIIQCWLDMAHERARGEEQARSLEEGQLASLLGADAS